FHAEAELVVLEGSAAGVLFLARDVAGERGVEGGLLLLAEGLFARAGSVGRVREHGERQSNDETQAAHANCPLRICCTNPGTSSGQVIDRVGNFFGISGASSPTFGGEVNLALRGAARRCGMSLLPPTSSFAERVEALFAAVRGRGLALGALDRRGLAGWAGGGGAAQGVAPGGVA